MSTAFEAGALIYRIQTMGAEVFEKELAANDASLKKVGNTAASTGKATEELGTKQDSTAKKTKDASKATEELGKSQDNTGKKTKTFGKELNGMSEDAKRSATTVGTAALAIGTSVALMVGLSIAKFSEFDVGMSNVAAATHAPQDELKKLGDAAVEAGADTAYSAREAADAQEELAKAGLDTADVLGGGLKGSLSLAAAGQLEVATAAAIASTTLKQFNLDGSETEHVADLLAAGAGKAQGEVEDLGLALGYVGPVAAGLGVSLEETTGTLALFAEKGQLGEKAGTSLRGVMMSLTAPTMLASSTMKEYGINVFDAQGKFVGMAGVAGQLKTAFTGLSDAERTAAMGRIFGNEQITAANILYQGGAEAVDNWTKAVDESGFAAETAAIKQDNLTGDIEKLGGAMDSALIKTGAGANDVMREMVQIVTFLVDSYGALPEPVQQGALVLGVATAATLLLGGTMLVAVPKIAEFRMAVQSLNGTMKGTAIAGGAVGLAITAAVAILGFFASKSASAAQSASAFTDTLDDQTGALTDNTRAAIVKQLQDRGLYDFAKKAGYSQKELTDAVYEGGDSLKEITDKFTQLNTVTNLWGETNAFAAGNAQDALEDVTEGLALSQEAWKNETAATDKASESADDASGSYDELGGSVDTVVSSLQDLATEIDTVNGKNLDARDAARQLEQAYDDFDASLKENGQTLDITTEKGRANQEALDAIADAAMTSGQAVIDAGGGYDAYKASLQGSREELLTRINELGIVGDEAATLADQILRIPSETEWKLRTDTSVAEANLRRIQNLINGIGATMQSHVSNGPGGSGGMTQHADGGVVSYFANGGLRENHVAQFARAGTMRVWAEPETGGEAYIPMAPAKRGRSTAILSEVATQFGYQLVPAGDRSFADGGRTGSGSSPAPSFNVVVSSKGGIDLTEYIDVKIEKALDEEESAYNAGYSGY